MSVVAPSGPFDEALLFEGLARLGELSFQVPPGLGARRAGYLAGSDDERLLELQTALDDPETAAILVARGGYGLARIVERLDWSSYLRQPKWIVGFSDASVLLSQSWQRGVGCIHGPNATTLAKSDEQELTALKRILFGHPLAQSFPLSALNRPITDVSPIQGPLVAGNLTVLFAEAASGRLHLPKGAILVLEDVTETSYRVDRMLQGLHDGGHLSSLGALVFGDFTDCSSGRYDVPVEDVLFQHAKRLPYPCACGLPVGHGAKNSPLLIGTTAELMQGRDLTLQCALSQVAP